MMERSDTEVTKKDTNPKDAIGVSKTPVSTIPSQFIMGTGLAMMEGAIKYRRHNYRVAGIRYSVYYDALMRHMMAWWEGEDIDPDSGLSHLYKASACIAIMVDAMHSGIGNDDRPPKMESWIPGMNDLASQLLGRYPEGEEPYTEKNSRTE